MQGHDERPGSDIVSKPGEADEDDCGHVVDDLFLEILQKRHRSQRTWIPLVLPPLHFVSQVAGAPSKAPTDQRTAL